MSTITNTTTQDIANLDTVAAWNDPTTADLAVVDIMQWRGTRDALLARTINSGPAARKALLANLDAFTYRHGPEAMRSKDAFWSMVSTIAALHWLDGDGDAALILLMGAPAEHRMAALLVKVIVSGMPADLWAAQMASITEDACLAFAAEERTRAAAASDAE